jgi:hypothetical protein
MIVKCNFFLAPWGEDARRAGEGPQVRDYKTRTVSLTK